LWPANIVADITCNPDKFRKVMNADVFLLQRVIGKNFVKKIHEVIIGQQAGQQNRDRP
jgi:hypothetical protein